jgi:hypothetical protein
MAFGMDPEVTRYFQKIIRSLVSGFLWFMINITAGIYFELAYGKQYPAWVHILFFVWLAASLAFALWYNFRVWRK